MTCNVCGGFGFINSHAVPTQFEGDIDLILNWLKTEEGRDSDAQVCGCCGDGETWYGIPGGHYSGDDPAGMNGPYASNGGYCKCH